jgi:hypothetical protein
MYSMGLALVDSLTLSRDDNDLVNFEVLSLRTIGIFSYWLIVKNLAGSAERKGYSYKLVMVMSILGLPTLAGLLSLLVMNIF